ncbi:MAG: hypothetical protein H7Z21_05215 [Hymenobacter sp.]|nr:hypothetical protein [Hymenobacter sp.]
MPDSNPQQRERQAFDSVSVSAPVWQVVGQQFAHSDIRSGMTGWVCGFF